MHFLQILASQRSHSLLELTFRAVELQQSPKFDIFQKALFCILTSGTKKLALKAAALAAGGHL